MLNQTGKCPHCNKYIDTSLKQCPKCNSSLENTLFENQMLEDDAETPLNNITDSLIGIVLKTFGIALVLPIIILLVAWIFSFLLWAGLPIIIGLIVGLIVLIALILPFVAFRSYLDKQLKGLGGILGFVMTIVVIIIVQVIASTTGEYVGSYVPDTSSFARQVSETSFDYFVSYLSYIHISLLIVFIVLVLHQFLIGKNKSRGNV
jgi:hypothetical protein